MNAIQTKKDVSETEKERERRIAKAFGINPDAELKASTKRSNEGLVVATGGWASDKLKKLACAESPRGKHFMKDVFISPSVVKDESLVTSECKYCGCRIVDCPTIAVI